MPPLAPDVRGQLPEGHLRITSATGGRDRISRCFTHRMRAKKNRGKRTPNFSRRQKIPRKPAKRRNGRSIPSRVPYIPSPHFQGSVRAREGGVADATPIPGSIGGSHRLGRPRSNKGKGLLRCGPKRPGTVRPSGAPCAGLGEGGNVRPVRAFEATICISAVRPSRDFPAAPGRFPLAPPSRPDGPRRRCRPSAPLQA